ncbi:50S ribosomal protein L9 [Candidatus Uhrbacteria bacterium]|nr:50S ribosomal protein L9 [Candidatus Uhrbacteria bacterium]
MKVILKEDVRGVGRKHEVRNVADGYGRNFLLARGKAALATPQAVKNAGSALALAEAERAKKEAALGEDIKKLNGETIVVFAKANEKGSLFAGLGNEQVAALLKKMGYKGITAEVLKIDEPIKTAGDHIVPLLLGGKKAGEFTLKVEKE